MSESTEWFVRDSRKIHGPFTADQLRKLARRSEITRDMGIRRGTDGEWVTAAKVGGLFATVGSEPEPQLEQDQLDEPVTNDDVLEWLGDASPRREARMYEAPLYEVPVYEGLMEEPPTSEVTNKPETKGERERQESSDTKPCPFCCEPILIDAKKCKHCGEYLDFSAKEARRHTDGANWNPGVAAVLNLILPGSGYIYMGQAVRGIFWLLAVPFLYLFFWMCSGALLARDDVLTNNRAGLLLLICLGFPIIAHLSIVVHPLRISRR